MKARFIRISLILFIFITLLFCSLTLLVNTQFGSRWILHKVFNAIPGEVQVGKIQGRLYHTFTLNNVSVQVPGLSIKANKMLIDWHMMALLKGKFSISQLTIDGINIRLENNKSPESFSTLPMKIHFKETQINNLSIESPALSIPLHFDHLSLNAKIYPELLSVQLITQMSSPTDMNIRLEASGKLDNYHATLVVDQAKNRWSVEGDGDLEHCLIHTKHHQLLGGTVKLLANLYFGQHPSWSAEADIQGLHPEYLLSHWPGTINLKLKTSVDENRIDLALSNLSGNLKGHKISGEFHYQKLADQNQLLHSNLHWGEALIKADGKMNDQIALNWKIQFPDLQELLREYSLSGAFNSQGTLSGSLQKLNIQATANGQNIRFQDWSAQSVQIKAQYQNTQQPIQAGVIIDKAQKAEHLLGNLNAQLSGTQNQHSLQLLYTVNDNHLKLKADGHLSNQLWEGSLESISLDSPQIHHWQSQAPSALSLSHESLHVAPFCLQNGKESLCLNADWQKGSTLRAEIKAIKIPMELLNPWLDDMSLRGEFNLVATLLAAHNKTPSLDLQMNLSPGIFYYTMDDVTKPLAYQGGEITAQLNEHLFKANAFLKLLQNSQLKAKVYSDSHDWKAENWYTSPLQGEFQITAPQLDFLAALIPSIARTRGSATAQGSISGNLQHPIISGSATVSNASFTVPDVSGQINKLDATGALNNGILSYEGTGTAGEGSFKISGTTQVINKDLHTELVLHGNNMLISDTPGVKVIATPDLQMKIVNKVMLLTGKIFIPRGVFRSYDYNDTLELPDEISYRQPTPLKPEAVEPVQLTSFIDLKLGDNISIDSNGLKGKLSGNFEIRDIPGKATTALGSLFLKEGRYNFRGQVLSVDRGVLNFNGGPVDNPNLNVRAVRHIGTFGAYKPTGISDQNRIVGINITGTLAKHKLTLFSEPDDITQTDILSYLVLGQSTVGVSGSSTNAQALMGAAQALNLTGDGGGTITKLKSQLEKKLGLSELDITSYETKNTKVLNQSTPESTIQHTAFVLGRYLSPKLYVNYSFDILDHTNVFRIRYFLNKKWSVQSESSYEGNALDILYSFERG
jgi:translocation and assembly module TamB